MLLIKVDLWPYLQTLDWAGKADQGTNNIITNIRKLQLLWKGCVYASWIYVNGAKVGGTNLCEDIN